MTQKAEGARRLHQGADMDPYFPDQLCGITYKGIRIHGSPKATILMANHGNDLRNTSVKNQNGPLPHSTA